MVEHRPILVADRLCNHRCTHHIVNGNSPLPHHVCSMIDTIMSTATTSNNTLDPSNDSPSRKQTAPAIIATHRPTAATFAWMRAITITSSSLYTAHEPNHDTMQHLSKCCHHPAFGSTPTCSYSQDLGWTDLSLAFRRQVAAPLNSLKHEGRISGLL